MSQRNILLCGLLEDPHLQQVGNALQRSGHAITIWNSRDPQTIEQLQWNIPKNNSVSKWDAIWVRQLPPLFPSAHIQSNGLCHVNAIRKQRSLRSFFLQWLIHQQEIGTRLLPRLQEGSYDQNKGHQLQLARRSGLSVPHTYCTNNNAAAMTFTQENETPCIIKPIIGGALAQTADKTNITQMLRDFGPIMVQAHVTGKPCRVLWLDDRCLGAFELPITPTVDWRALFEQPDAMPVWQSIQLSEPTEERLRRFVHGQSCQLLGFDFIRTEDDFVFLEANTAPAWCDLPLEPSQKISEAVAQFLA
ncbi:MAG: hypothetical protein CMH56_02485 [Myxococcales bacterium]|nr:hypothetical protein [Myxococcales bacterium]|tara:strand:+ start:3547 stop:4458 length:912 start_codon:yes stop_codon:yes gene_type:complete